MKLRVLVTDDHKIIREGLQALIDKQPDMEVVGDAETGREAVKLAKKLTPHVVVMDVSMPDLNGVEATRQILKNQPDVKIVALSMYSDRRFVCEMFKAGAHGYMLKDCAFDELSRAIDAVTNNRRYLSPAIADVVLEDSVQPSDDVNVSAFSQLTSRQREVLQMLAEGKTTKKIAITCRLSIKTIETHRQHIMDKLDIHTVAELTKYAVREGLTSLTP